MMYLNVVGLVPSAATYLQCVECFALKVNAAFCGCHMWICGSVTLTYTNSLVLPLARATPCVAVNRWSGALIRGIFIELSTFFMLLLI